MPGIVEMVYTHRVTEPYRTGDLPQVLQPGNGQARIQECSACCSVQSVLLSSRPPLPPFALVFPTDAIRADNSGDILTTLTDHS